MKKLVQFIKRAFDKEIDGTGLALFRIMYCLILLCEIGQIFYFRHLIYDKVPYIHEAEINFGIPIVLWGLSVAFLLFGFFTRFFSIINYLLSLILIGSITTYEYHVFYAYLGVNFLFMFMPISRCISLDRLLLKLKYSNTTFQYNPPKKIPQLYYYIPVFLGLGLVYIDSIFYKMASSMWYTGLGSWMPSSLPMVNHVNTSWLLNQEYLIKGVGFMTVAFETVFVFTFFRKKWRLPLLVLGLILHLGILLQFPIPWFALTACALYILMVPVSWWNKLFASSAKKTRLYVYYDSECPLCVRTKITVTHLDTRKMIEFKTVQFDSVENKSLKNIAYDTLLDDIHSVDTKGNVYSGVGTYIMIMNSIWYLKPLSLLLRLPGINHIARAVYGYIAKNRTTERCTEENCGYNPSAIPDDAKFKVLQNLTLRELKLKVLTFFLALATFLQICIIYNSMSVNNAKEFIGFKGSTPDKIISKAVAGISVISKISMGITNHAVFTEKIHFNDYNHIIAVVYKDKNNNRIWLPIIDENGQPDLYDYSFNWVKWTFRVNSTNINQQELATGIRDFSAFWAARNGVNLNDATFEIMVKKIDSPNGWQYNYLNNQIAKPWMSGGYVKWRNNEFTSHIADIEKL